MLKNSFLSQIPSLLKQDEGRLAEVVLYLPFSAHVRDVGSGKYIFANQHQARYQGCQKIEEVLGITFDELHAQRKDRFPNSLVSPMLEKNYQEINKANYLVEKENKALRFMENTIRYPGFIYCGPLLKWPILSSQGKTTAVFTLSLDTTRNVDLPKLYTLYKRHFPKKIAIDQLIQYLKIKPYFHTNPTEAELIILLTMRRTSAHKLIAQQLNIQSATVDTHIRRLKEKLNKIALEPLLMLLRDFHYEKKIFF